MSRAELPHTVSHHHLIDLDLGIDTTEGSDAVIVGDELQGALHLTCKSANLLLGNMEVELVVQAEAKTTSDSLHEVLYDRSIAFQGAGLPASSAVYPDTDDEHPGYYRARRGTTRFRLSIPIPGYLPSSHTSPFASISYTLHATVEFQYEGMTQILHTFRTFDVVQSSSAFDMDLTGSVKAEDGARLPQIEGGGSLILSAEHGRARGWVSSADPNMVVIIDIRNSTAFWTLAPVLRLMKRTTIHFPHEPFEVSEIVCQEQYDDRYAVPARAASSFTLNLSLPPGSRSTHSTVFDVQYSLSILVHLVGTPSGKQRVVSNLPLEILDPASVPPQIWLDAESLSTERGQSSQREGTRREPRAFGRRWSMPAGTFESLSALLSPLSLGQSSKTASPKHGQSIMGTHDFDPVANGLTSSGVDGYPQPEFVVHQQPELKTLPRSRQQPLPPILEDLPETKAKQTSRHLRETPGNRGRSVSPPLMPSSRSGTVLPDAVSAVSEPSYRVDERFAHIHRPKLHDQRHSFPFFPSAVFPTSPRGPRPVPRRVSTSGMQLRSVSSSSSTTQSSVPSTTCTITESYTEDTSVPCTSYSRSTIASPRPVKIGGDLSPVVKDMPASLELQSVSPAANSKDVINSPLHAVPSSVQHSRRSVFDLFESISSVPSPISNLSRFVNIGPNGSARGGRGGQVTTLRELFTGSTGSQGLQGVGSPDRPSGEIRPIVSKRYSLPAGLEGFQGDAALYVGTGHHRSVASVVDGFRGDQRMRTSQDRSISRQ
ncbi:hypothetical protein BD324DRAFT_652539 [Kockovaella imperatae]|uniref:Arrestin-like N-terminal domain-containing protein n=1 Tax=Kockovaella imperatae TaxID=4999 RepID=A0A1Y1UCZ0_9TREE|nr:hypothetical protein BD324DRAFT_652539 [Kockovaella imperatae]ORX35407.1 hypothetical protein BD324DRAFT_652539 [Kockovaella imperatae]